MKFWLGLLIGTFLGIGGTIGGYYFKRYVRVESSGLVLTFTEEEIQTRLGKKYPKSERLLEIIPVKISEPKVRFLGESNRVELTIAADAAVPLMQTYQVEGVFTASVRYEHSDHTLRLSDITVESFRASTLPKEFEEPLRKTMTVAALKYLDDQPVHTVKDEDVKGELVKMFLQEVAVKDGKLEVKLGL